KGQPFFFGNVGQRAIHQHAVDVIQLLYRTADGGKVGHHATEPAVGHEGHFNAAGSFGDNIPRLLLGSDEHDLLAGAGDAAGGVAGALHSLKRTVQVDDVDAFALHENVGRHFGVPLFLEVAEVDAGIQQI